MSFVKPFKTIAVSLSARMKSLITENLMVINSKTINFMVSNYYIGTFFYTFIFLKWAEYLKKFF